jgi:Ca-activated chloride channel family protein
MPDATVTLELTTDHRRVAPGATKVHLVATVVAGATAGEAARPDLSIVLALDVSGSMAGPPLEHVVRSVERIVDLLGERDRLGVVAFSEEATEVSPLARLDGEARRAIKARVRRLVAEGGTNVEAGLGRARGLLPARGAHERQAVLLLSDGVPNRGAWAPAELSALAARMRPDVSVSALGYGAKHDEETLSAIAEGGGGRYRFIPDPASCALDLAQAVGAQGDVAAEAVELAVRPSEGVEVLRVLGGRAMRVSAGGLVVPLEDVPRGGVTHVAFALELGARFGGAGGEVAWALLRYRPAGAEGLTSVEASAGVEAGASELDPAAHGKVLLVRCDEVRAGARALADRRQFDAAAAVVRAFLAEIEAAPGYVAADGSPLSEAREALLDDAMAYERRPSPEAYSVYKKSMHGMTLATSNSMPPSKFSREAALAELAAGSYPRARLRVVGGPRAGAMIALGARNCIGRMAGVEVLLPDDGVSRRHAEIFAADGAFWVTDLGSTNTTLLNGRPVGSRPSRLATGDVVKVGGSELVYEELT